MTGAQYVYWVPVPVPSIIERFLLELAQLRTQEWVQAARANADARRNAAESRIESVILPRSLR
jgi:hypothetical protein